MRVFGGSDQPGYFDPRGTESVFSCQISGSNPKANQIFGAFGYSVEHYVCSILDAIFPTSSSLVRQFYCNPHASLNSQDVELCDALVVGRDYVLMLEVKAIFLPDDATHNSEEQYSAAVSRDTLEAKRPRNLVCCWLVTKEPLELAGKPIFPILLVLDALMDGPKHRELLASEFTKSLAAERTSGGIHYVGQVYVRELTLMTLRDLELLEGASVTLVDVLRQYLASDVGGLHDHSMAHQAVSRGCEQAS